MIDWINKLFGLADKTTDIIKETVVDKDKQNELIAHLDEMKEVTRYLAELNTKTIPWVDAFHKMGRQILNYITIIAVVVLMLTGKTITPEVALILGGPNAVYQFIKGKGK